MGNMHEKLTMKPTNGRHPPGYGGTCFPSRSVSTAFLHEPYDVSQKYGDTEQLLPQGAKLGRYQWRTSKGYMNVEMQVDAIPQS